MQYKILEAMICSKPVVTTNLGLGSIKCTGSMVDVVLAETAEEFAHNILHLSRNPDARSDIGSKARKSVLSNYNSDNIDRKINDLVNEL